MTPSMLKSQLKDGKLSKIYFFYGEEDYLKQHYIGIIKKTFNEQNIITFDSKVTLSKIETAIDVLPIFAEKRLVILDHTKIFKAKDKRKEAIINGVPEGVCLIIVEDKKSELSKTFLPSCDDVDFQKLPTAPLIKWTASSLAKNKKMINQQAIDLLIEKANSDMNIISNETKKLASLTTDKITPDIIDQIVAGDKDYNMFAIIDCILENKPEKWTIWNELKRAGESPIPIISTLWLQCYYAKNIINGGRAFVDCMPPNRKFLGNKIMSKSYNMDRLDSLLHLCEKYSDDALIGAIDHAQAMDILLAV